MIRITGITKEKGCHILWSDDEPVARLDADAFRAASIDIGFDVEESRIEALAAASDGRLARKKALSILARRDHSKRELVEKLSRTVPPTAAQAAADRMEELGLLDDRAYAARLFADLTGRKGYAPRRALREMRAKGVGRETAEEAALTADVDAVPRLDEMMERKYSRILAAPGGERKVAAALQRLGYSYDEIRAALRRAGNDP